MWVGAQYCSLPAFDLETFCRKSSELKVTDLHLVPPVALLLATSPVAQKYDLASLQRIVISAAPLKVCMPTAFLFLFLYILAGRYNSDYTLFQKSVQLLLKKRLPHVRVCQGSYRDLFVNAVSLMSKQRVRTHRMLGGCHSRDR